MKNVLLASFLFVLLFSACRNVQLYNETTYPSEEDFATTDTLAFYLEDLLWIPFGWSAGLGFFNPEPNTFNYNFRQEAPGGYAFEILSAMRIATDNDIILDQTIHAELNNIVLSELPGVFVLDSTSNRYWTLKDQKQDKLFISTADHPITLEIPVFDTLQGRMEGFFEGQLVNREDPSEVVTVTEGRFSISF
ncbi:MAG: hypothetical protein ACE362_08095 [Phaeodactylibacter xiamenensis]|uniref:Uncharacterized protein n=1 Tax=Phaeodactylibacter xiamenensis TaxID=1524460 RepID=A0A098SAG9_9BACT|nr:hypothetical protein [Phaeodactylibacter xiamenensis]KGE88633.1 hypothetical protein IX84_08165 [Phaeodactylibacter xiamenensis]MCR9051424.1 hypothetical protein [bacterium]